MVPARYVLHLFAGSGGASLGVFCSEKKLSEQLSAKSIREKRSWPDSVMVSYRPFPSGTMSELSEWITRKRESISSSLSASETGSPSQEGSPARTSLLQDALKASQALARAYGRRYQPPASHYVLDRREQYTIFIERGMVRFSSVGRDKRPTH